MYVTNTETDAGTLNDNISIDQLVISVTQTDPNPPTCILANNSELTVVNSFVDIDYLNPAYIAGKDNKMRLTADSHAYLYNMTVSQDDDSIGGDDRNEFGNDPVNPFETFDTSEAYYYRWMDIPIVDSNNNPVAGANVSATGNYSDPAAREIDSFISVPPRSFTPAASACRTPSGPILTHENGALPAMQPFWPLTSTV